MLKFVTKEICSQCSCKKTSGTCRQRSGAKMDVSDWLNANKLTLNAKKSNYVIFRPYQCKFNYSVNIVLIDNCTQITTTPHCKDLVKCLGVLLDSIYLSWKFHINNVALKVNRTVELLPVFGTSSHAQSF